MSDQLKRKILLIDDEVDILEATQDVLASADFEVLTAKNKSEALHLIATNHGDLCLIICDYKLGETETGFDVRIAMNENHREVPFAILSGYLTKELALEGIEHGICAFIDKPIEATSLKEIAIEKSQARFEEVQENLEMITEFKGDALDLLDDIEASILTLESDPHNISNVDAAMRLLHTIKGTSGCLGLTEVQKFSHAYEDFFGPVKRGDWPATKTIVSSALKAFDQLKLMVMEMDNLSYQHQPTDQLVKMFDITESTILEEAKEVAKSKPKKSNNNTDSDLVGDKSDEISVATELLDEFMEQSGELTVLRSMVVKHVKSLEQTYGNTTTLERLVEALDEMHSVSSNIQNKIEDIRKVPVKSILRPIPRVVRDAATATNKQVNLNIEGDSLRIDTSIAQVLTSSLVHMVRNSVDHGLEASAKDRETAGKDAEGQVSINCYESGEEVIVEISDDGRGISVEAVKAKCIEKDLLTTDQLEAMSDNEIRAMIFEAGFSTAQQVTSVSGRGVGMDMVRSSVDQVGGHIRIQSKMGEGTKFTLVLPIPKSVLIIRALFMKSCGQVMALNQDEIHKVIYIEENDRDKWLRDIHGEMFLQFDGKLLPVLDLRKTLKLEAKESLASTELSADKFSRLVVVRTPKGLFCIEVDEVLDNEEIVVKPLSDGLKTIGVYAGATFLGDGKTALVVDTEGLAQHAGILKQVSERAERLEPETQEEIYSEARNELLIAKTLDGQTVAVSLRDVYRLENFKISSIEYVGSQPVINYSGEPIPLLELVEKAPMKDQAVSEMDSLKTLVVSEDSGLVGYTVAEILDVHTAIGELDTRVSNPHFAGSFNINGKTIALVRPKTSLETSNLEKRTENQSEPTDVLKQAS